MKKYEHGFSNIVLILAMLVVAISFVGWRVFSPTRSQAPTGEMRTEQNAASEELSPEAKADVSEGWQKYSNNEEGVSFSYPSDWGDVEYGSIYGGSEAPSSDNNWYQGVCGPNDKSEGANMYFGFQISFTNAPTTIKGVNDRYNCAKDGIDTFLNGGYEPIDNVIKDIKQGYDATSEADDFVIGKTSSGREYVALSVNSGKFLRYYLGAFNIPNSELLSIQIVNAAPYNPDSPTLQDETYSFELFKQFLQTFSIGE